MKVIIIGGGLVGMTIAHHFILAGHEVVVIDRNLEIIRTIEESLDALAIRGEATNQETLMAAGLESAGLILAVTNSDESNIVITLMAHAKNPEARIILRVRGDQYLASQDLWNSGQLGRTYVISPERAASDAVLRLLEVEQAFEVIPFLDGSLRIAGFRLDDTSPLVGKPLKDSIGQLDLTALVVAVARNEEVLIPTGNFVLLSQDRIYIALAHSDANKLLPLIGRTPSRQRKKVIAGGGWKGFHIAQELEKLGNNPIVIEKDRERCRYLALNLPRSSIIHGDATKLDLLDELNIEHTNFIAVTDHQEVNFLTALIANKLGVNRAIALLDNEAYLTMAPALGIDAVVSPRLSAVREILRFLGSDQVLDAAPMLDGKLNALLVEIKTNSRLANMALKDARIPAGIIVAALLQNNQIIIPSGPTILTPGDKALFIVYPNRREQLYRLLGED